MSNLKKICIYLIIYGITILSASNIIKSIWLESNSIIVKTLMILVMLLGMGNISICVFGIIIQCIYYQKFAYKKRVILKKNIWKSIIMITIYSLFIILANIVKIDGTQLMILIGIFPFALHRICIKCDTYFVSTEDTLIYLSENYVLYNIVNAQYGNNKTLILEALSEHGKTEKILLDESIFIKEGIKEEIEMLLKKHIMFD